MTTSQQPQLVRLPDGRQLAFADYGPPDGMPCIVLSGMPGSRLAPAWAFPDALLTERDVRLLGVDRPGYGRSDPNPRMSALGVAEDLGVLCAAAGLERVAVLGISVGAPFALAYAVRWPQRVGSLLLSSPMGPWEQAETRAGMSRRNRRYFALARRAPTVSRAACWLWARMALVGLRGDRERLLARLSKGLPPPDREVLAEVAADPGRWAAFVADTAEAFRQGGAGSQRTWRCPAGRGASSWTRSTCRPGCGTGRPTRTCRSRPPDAWPRRSPAARPPSPTRGT